MPVLRSSTSEADLIDNLVESHRQQVPPEQMNVVTAAPILEPNNRGRRTTDSGSLVLILLISVMIAVLVFRRFYIMNEWRFTPHEGNDGEL